MKQKTKALIAIAMFLLSLSARATTLGYAQFDQSNFISHLDALKGLLTWRSDAIATASNGMPPGSFALDAQFNDQGGLIGGLLTLSDQSALFYAGRVESYEIRIMEIKTCPMDGSDFRCPPGTQQGRFDEIVKLQDVYVSPLLPKWGNSTWATTYSWTNAHFGDPYFQGSVLSSEELFRVGWTASNLIQSHLYSEVVVPETGTLALLGLGLAGLGLTRRREAN